MRVLPWQGNDRLDRASWRMLMPNISRCRVVQVKVFVSRSESITAFPTAPLPAPLLPRPKAKPANKVAFIEQGTADQPALHAKASDNPVLVTAHIREVISSIAPSEYTFHPYAGKDKEPRKLDPHFSVSFSALTATEQTQSLFPISEDAEDDADAVEDADRTAPVQEAQDHAAPKSFKMGIKKMRESKELDLSTVYDKSEENSPGGIEELLLQDRPKEDIFAEARQRFEQPGCVLILKFDIECEDAVVKMSANMYLRSALECAVLGGDGLARVMKYDDGRAFCFSPRAGMAIKSALRAQVVVARCNERFANREITINYTAGMCYGNLLVLEGDYYGNPVNFASKLGEDHAVYGEILLSHLAFDDLEKNNPEMLELLSLKDGFVKISGVEIPFKYVTMPADASGDAMFPPSAYPEEAAIRRAAASASHVRLMCVQLLDDDMEKVEKVREQLSYMKKDCTMLQSDMSGFTRLTKKYGILHFLSLVAHCRKIFRDNLPFYDGHVLKYDGDNVIAMFTCPEDAAECVKDIIEDVRTFNAGKEKDFQIRIKLGTSHGETLVVQHDCVGDAWEACCILGEDTAEVGEVLITDAIHEQLKDLDHLGAKFEPRMTYDGTTPIAHFNMSFEDTEGYGHSLSQTMAVLKHSKKWLAVRGKSKAQSLEQMMLAKAADVAPIDQMARILYEKDGCVLIMKVTILDDDPVASLCILNYLRSGLETLFATLNADTTLIKSSGNYLFAYGYNAAMLLRAALCAARMCESYSKKFANREFGMCFALDVGKVLLQKDDMFGDPVNVAFKLADTNEGGTVCITNAYMQSVQEGPPDDILDIQG